VVSSIRDDHNESCSTNITIIDQPNINKKRQTDQAFSLEIALTPVNKEPQHSSECTTNVKNLHSSVQSKLKPESVLSK
jgi:hypothetical protein